VLVSSNFQARLIKSGLEARGVPAVVGGDASVFSTDDARLVNLLLDTLVDPQRLSVIRTLLTSRLVGLSVPELEALMADDLAWSGTLEMFARARTIALEKGVLSGIRYVLDALDVEKHMISWSDGERRMTNLRHLTELLYDEQRRGFRNLAGLAQWLRTRRNDPELAQADVTQIRLESDENRVTIMTMHSSKGLQFPVVYAPYLWETRKKSSEVALYVDAGRDRFVLGIINAATKRLLEVRGQDESRMHEGLRTQDAENVEDRVRLMYVAVTRSRYRCYVPYTQVRTSQTRGTDSPFTAMLLRDPAAGSVQWRDLNEFDRMTGVPADDVVTGLLSRLDTSRFCMYPGRIDLRAAYTPESSVSDLCVRQLADRAVPAMQQHVFVESYSSLKDRVSDVREDDTMGQSDLYAAEELRYQTPAPGPDDDIAATSKAPQDRSSPVEDRRSVFAFPRGAHTGTFWHYIFETIDFADPSTFADTVHRACGEFGFDEITWGEVLLHMVHAVVETNLGDFRLSDVAANRTLREMEFYMPYNDAAMTDYQQWILQQTGSAGEVTGSPRSADIRHYLTGFIDLLVEHDGKYYILDYKSDHLGDTPEDYAPEALHAHMTEKRYVMQYYFYALALYRFLEFRLGAVDFDAVFGGVYYLFLRGMDGTPGRGVFADRPDAAAIAAFAGRLQPALDGGQV
jgi:exodeoxyribonuclease V beta subunit